MSGQIFAVNLNPGTIEAFLVVEDRNNLLLLDSRKRIYDQSSILDFKTKLIDLILEMEKRSRTNFSFAVVGVSKDIGEEIAREIKFLRKNPLKPISEKEFKKMIEECQKELLLKHQKITNPEFPFVLVSAKIKEVLVDQKKVINPLGLLGEVVSISIENIYLPVNFYKIVSEIFTQFKIEISFEVN